MAKAKPNMKNDFARALMISLAKAGKLCAEREESLFVKGADWQEGYIAGMRAAVRIVADQAKTEIPESALAYSAEAVEKMEARQTMTECGNCQKRAPESELKQDITHLASRVDVGGAMPAGECRACGALAYLIKKELR